MRRAWARQEGEEQLEEEEEVVVVVEEEEVVVEEEEEVVVVVVGGEAPSASALPYVWQGEGKEEGATVKQRFGTKK
jgi:hypothetical protein